jgi:hypothetical protein
MSPEGVRRSGRIQKDFAILLMGSDTDGKVFAEETRTVVLSRHGAGVVSQHKLIAEEEMIICRLDKNEEAEVRVLGQIGSQFGNYTYGVAFLDPNVDFWGVEFPPLTQAEKAWRHRLLECSICNNREPADHSDIVWDVYAINECIVRYCKRCQVSTIWRQAADYGDDKSVLPESGPQPERAPSQTSAAQPAIPIPAAQAQNRRKRVRAKVNLTACIRRPGFDDDIVACEDLSRGGLRFMSNRRYYDNSIIEVAVPYAPGAPGIFVPAEIVYVHDLPKRKLFRCGAAFRRIPFRP